MPQDAFATPSIDQDAALGATRPGAAPPLSFFDRVRLGDKEAAAGPDWGWNQGDYEGRIAKKISDALTERGVKFMPSSVGGFGAERDIQRRMLAALAEVRKADPHFLPDYADVIDGPSLTARAHRDRNAELARVNEAAPDGLGFAGFLGGIVHGLQDPTSYIPVGGGPVTGSIARRILTVGAREAAANVAFTVGSEPLVQQDAAALGIERTAGDFAFDVGVSAVAGGAIGAAVPAGKAAKDALTPLDKKVARAIEDAPLPGGAANPFASFDVRLARAFADAVPPEKRTPDQQAALNAIERDAEIRATSPFIAGPEGDKAHAELMDLGGRTLRGEVPPASARPAKAVAREDIASGRADTANMRMPAREQLKARIHRAEATATNDFNPLSGATGPYQFVARTWVNLFRKRYPNDKRSFEAIAALRRDPRLNDLLINDLIAENAAALRRYGHEESAGNLYLAHFLGSDRAVHVLNAAPDTAIGRLLPDEYFRDNPWMKRDWTAAQLAAWADRKMGASPGERPGDVRTAEAGAAAGGVRVIDDLPDVPHPETGRYDVEAMLGFAGDDRPMLRPELFDSAEDHAEAQFRFEAERDAIDGFDAVRSSDELFDPARHFAAVRDFAKSDAKVTLDNVAEALGIRPDQARRVVQSMMATDAKSPLIFTRREGRLMRRPRPIDKGPRSLVEFLSERGGLKDTGGELAAMDAHHWHKGGPFRRKLIQAEGEQLDDAFIAAIEHGYFPMQQGQMLADPSYLPDSRDLLDAIGDELRGNPLYRLDEHDALQAQLAKRFGRGDEPEPEATPGDIWERIGDDPELSGLIEPVFFRADELGYRFDDDMLEQAVLLAADGMDMDRAIFEAVDDAAARALDDYAAQIGELGYAFDNDGRRFADDTGLPEERPAEPDGGAPGDGGGRPAADAGPAAASRAGLAQSAHDPAAAEFADPVGPAATRQADSIEHDLRMEAAGQAHIADQVATALTLAGFERKGPTGNFEIRLEGVAEAGQVSDGARIVTVGIDERGRYLERYDGFDVAKDVDLREFDNNPDGAIAAVLDGLPERQRAALARAKAALEAPAVAAKYRIDEDGADSDLASILDEIDAGQKAAAEMRACMAPAKGPKE